MGLDITHTAKILGVSVKTVYNLLSRREIKSSRKVHGKHVFEAKDLVDFLEKRQSVNSSSKASA
ncbi:MAG: helix-turn-helix domain-containing protein [Bdellovibrionota bacterium]